MTNLNSLREKDLNVFDEKPSATSMGCGLLLVFVLSTGAGVILHLTSLAAGRSAAQKTLLILPLVLLALYTWRALRHHRSIDLKSKKRDYLQEMETILAANRSAHDKKIDLPPAPEASEDSRSTELTSPEDPQQPAEDSSPPTPPAS